MVARPSNEAWKFWSRASQISKKRHERLISTNNKYTSHFLNIETAKTCVDRLCQSFIYKKINTRCNLNLNRPSSAC